MHHSLPPDPNKISDESRRDILIEQLINDTYECMVCYEKVLRYQPIWYCHKCYSIFHLTCIHKWATSSSGDTDEDFSLVPKKWRCPGCQSQNDDIPQTCRCFCGSFEYPETVGQGHMYSIPHSCGLKCNRVVLDSLCPHPCSVPCHPGPCPSCRLQVTRYCNCGKAMIVVHCGSETNSCGFVCQKFLKCSKHRCNKMCHPKSCGNCNSLVQMECHCGKESKIVPCSTKTRSPTQKFSCGRTCENFAKNGNNDSKVRNSFEKIFLRVKSSHEDGDGNTTRDISFFLCCCLPCASIFMYCLKLLSVIMGIAGLMYMDDCPNLNGVLIVIGVLALIGQFLNFCSGQGCIETTDWSSNICSSRLSSFVSLLWICSFLYFNIIVFGIDPRHVQIVDGRRFYFLTYYDYKHYCSVRVYSLVQLASRTSLILWGFVIGFYFWSLFV